MIMDLTVKYVPHRQGQGPPDSPATRFCLAALLLVPSVRTAYIEVQRIQSTYLVRTYTRYALQPHRIIPPMLDE
jgi:hypothetical protein